MYHPVDTAHALEVVLAQVLQANFLEEILLPALDTTIDTHWDVALLADHRAEAASVVASGQVGESIGQVVELALLKELRRHVVLQPQDLGHFHLNAHLSTDVAEQVVVGGVDLLGLLDWPVVEPEDDIAVVAVCVIELWACDRDGLVGVLAEDCEGAGGIEANAADGVWVDVVLGQGTLDSCTDASPDICGRLFLGEE